MARYNLTSNELGGNRHAVERLCVRERAIRRRMMMTLSRRARFLLRAHVPLPVLILAIALGACDRPAPGPAAGGAAAPTTAKATVTRAAFGALPDGHRGRVVRAHECIGRVGHRCSITAA